MKNTCLVVLVLLVSGALGKIFDLMSRTPKTKFYSPILLARDKTIIKTETAARQSTFLPRRFLYLQTKKPVPLGWLF